MKSPPRVVKRLLMSSCQWPHSHCPIQLKLAFSLTHGNSKNVHRSSSHCMTHSRVVVSEGSADDHRLISHRTGRLAHPSVSSKAFLLQDRPHGHVHLTWHSSSSKRKQTNVPLTSFPHNRGTWLCFSLECPWARVLRHFSRVRLFSTPWAVTRQALMSIGFSRQGYWDELSCPPPRGSSSPRDWTLISCVSHIGRQALYR